MPYPYWSYRQRSCKAGTEAEAGQTPGVAVALVMTAAVVVVVDGDDVGHDGLAADVFELVAVCEEKGNEKEFREGQTARLGYRAGTGAAE